MTFVQALHPVLEQGSPKSLCGQGDSSAPLPGGMGHNCEASALQPVTPPLCARCVYCLCLTRQLQKLKETTRTVRVLEN